jgi:hypothetical protein
MFLNALFVTCIKLMLWQVSRSLQYERYMKKLIAS